MSIRFGGGGASNSHFFIGGSYDLNDSGETIRRFAIEAGLEFDSGSAGRGFVNFPNTITVDRWTIRINVNSKTGSVTFNFLNNGVASNSNIVVGAGLTGIFQDLVNSDRIITPNDTQGQMDEAGSGAFLIDPVSLIMRAIFS